jgi:sodium transport system permease protein
LNPRTWFIIARKEIVDHARDRRSLLSSMLYVGMGPIVVLMLSFSNRSGGDDGPAALLGMTAVFALVAAFAGGMNVAMDAVAGERERRSLVALLVNPVRRADVVVGKWMAISAFGLAGVALNLAAFGAVLSGMPGALPAVSTAAHVALWLGLALALAPLALLAAAVELLISAVCRTTKEAHTYLSLLVFVPMMMGLFQVFFPAWSSAWQQVVPILGHQMRLVRGLTGAAGSVPDALALVTATLLLTIVALAGTSALLRRDNVVLADR